MAQDNASKGSQGQGHSSTGNWATVYSIKPLMNRFPNQKLGEHPFS
jgi:hypothetical protein